MKFTRKSFSSGVKNNEHYFLPKKLKANQHQIKNFNFILIQISTWLRIFLFFFALAQLKRIIKKEIVRKNCKKTGNLHFLI
jgi:hypothetical protein